jgi:hypothetical protein
VIEETVILAESAIGAGLTHAEAFPMMKVSVDGR